MTYHKRCERRTRCLLNDEHDGCCQFQYDKPNPMVSIHCAQCFGPIIDNTITHVDNTRISIGIYPHACPEDI